MDKQDREYQEKMKSNVEQLSEKAEEKAKKEAIKKIITIIGVKGVLIIILIILISSLLGVVFFAGALEIKDVSTKDKATSAKNQAIGNDALDKGLLQLDNGKYKISYDGKTGIEAIESILEDNDMNFDDFTEEEIECLYKCLKAEWATTYPNLGGKVDNKDIDSEYVQGIITIKRGKNGGKTVDLKYKPYEEFKNIKDSTALDYFSMKDGNIVVAAWSSSEIRYEPSNSMPDSIKSQYVNTGEQISISETSINYRSMIGIHSVPFELLLSLLINTEDVDFVSELADLAFDSTIEITVYDNTTETITVETEETHEETTYQKWVNYAVSRISEELSGTGKPLYPPYSGIIESDDNKDIGSKEKTTLDYSLTTTRINKSNSYVIGLTNVNSWIAQIVNTYTYTENLGEEKDLGLGTPNKYGPEELEMEEISTSDPEVEAFRRSKNSGPTTSKTETGRILKTTDICTIYGAKRQGTFTGENKLTKNTSKTNEYKYESSGKTTQSTGESFKKVYDNNPNAQAQLDCVASWLFELLEKTESTVDYVSVMKYLLYVCTGEDLGVDKSELEDLLLIHEVSGFQNMNVLIYGNDTEEKVWYSLKEIGLSDYAVAGVMGNIYGESGFNAAAIEMGSGEGHGLCQWSYGRKKQLIGYANSKGVDWSDVDTQIEFLIAEITKPAQGPAKNYASYQMMNKVYNGVTYNSQVWKDATSVEVATTAFCASFERPGQPRVQKRIDAAQKYYDKYKGKTLESFDNTNSSNIGFVNGNTFTDGTGKVFTLHKQGGANANVPYPARNGTLGRNGCGPTCCTIISSGYGYTDTPASLVSTGRNYSWDYQIKGYFADKGFETMEVLNLTDSQVKAYLMRGYKIVVRVNENGNVGSYNIGSYKHWYTMLDINGNKVFVGDPIVKGGRLVRFK